MKGKRRRLWEGCKTLLILLLSASAVYLASLALFPNSALSFLPNLGQSTPQPTGGENAFLSQTLRPAAFSVTWEEGRYALLYYEEDQEAFAQLSALLAEALSDAQSPRAVSQWDWRRALRAPGVFCEYLGEMPLDALSRWLSNQENPALAGYSASRLCVSGSTLFFRSQSGWYAADLTADLSQKLSDFSAGFSPNGARFAFEDSDYALLQPDSLILNLTPTAARLAGEDPAAVTAEGAPGDVLTRMLQVLSFHPQTNPLYAITGGWAITDGSETLRIHTQGSILYTRSESDAPRYPVEEGEALDVTRLLAEQTVGSASGSARLYLKELRQEEGVTTVTYGYAYRGAVIHTGDGGWAAQFTIEDGAVSAFVLRPRRYTVLEDAPETLLPQLQAAATLAGEGGRTLGLYYQDAGDGQALVPFWAVRAD